MFKSFNLFLSILVSVMLSAAAVFFYGGEHVAFDDMPEAAFAETNGRYEVSATAGVGNDQFWHAAACAVSEDFKCVNVNLLAEDYLKDHQAMLRLRDNSWVLSLDSAHYHLLCDTEEFCQARIREVLPTIVLSGMTREEALTQVALWTCDHLEYDFSAEGNKALKAEYQSARHSFTDGKGICATYAYTFSAMVAAIPFDSVTGLVDWNTTMGDRIETCIISNADHAWAGVCLDGIWHHCDVCYYDGTRDSSCLDLPASVLSGFPYSGYAFVKTS